MKPAAFAYHAPEGVDEALALLAEHGPEAKPLAGGQSLVAAMNVRHALLQAEAMPHVAHSQIRNRGTLGGSLAHAAPAAELPAVMVAPEAPIRLRSREAERWLSAEDFFVRLFATALEPGELLVEVALPPPGARTGWAFEELSRHSCFGRVPPPARSDADSAGDCSRGGPGVRRGAAVSRSAAARSTGEAG